MDKRATRAGEERDRMQETSLSGKVAVVTGGGRGMGRAIANAFAAEGADVAIIDRLPDHLDEVRAEIEAHGRRGFAVHADLTEVAQIPEIFASIRNELGDLDILMNNAGVQPIAPAIDTTEEIWDLNMDVNAKALFFCAREAGRHFLERRKRGKIINTCSTFSVICEPEFVAYCASKGAVLQITRALASEWARHGINVNGIGPTAVYTEMTKPQLDDPEYRAEYLGKLPARTLPEASDIADAVVFLAGPRSDFIHGHMLLVDCGETIV
jgi:NAD(P)-dependent dehydrogenase (short-subunit alcohol dehydrogenase family)